MLNRRAIPRWNEVREQLQAFDSKVVRAAAVSVGKFQAEEIPNDVADMVISLFRHADPEVRAEAVRALGIHWRLARVLDNIVELLKDEEDWHVQISALDALGALGREYPYLRLTASQSLAKVALNGERFADDERMVAYRELLYVEQRMEPKQYRQPDPPLTEQLARFDADRPWVEALALADSGQHETP
jgi:HEAT repeat protein